MHQQYWWTPSRFSACGGQCQQSEQKWLTYFLRCNSPRVSRNKNDMSGSLCETSSDIGKQTIWHEIFATFRSWAKCQSINMNVIIIDHKSNIMPWVRSMLSNEFILNVLQETEINLETTFRLQVVSKIGTRCKSNNSFMMISTLFNYGHCESWAYSYYNQRSNDVWNCIWIELYTCDDADIIQSRCLLLMIIVMRFIVRAAIIVDSETIGACQWPGGLHRYTMMLMRGFFMQPEAIHLRWYDKTKQIW
jgi:hypothetical protein